MSDLLAYLLLALLFVGTVALAVATVMSWSV